MIGLGLGLVRQAVRNASGQLWTPAQLFTNGEQGVWYEPKPEYLYQDAAGTTPVTADGDPVGLMLDLLGNGNYATQSVSASRPTYRKNWTLHVLTYDGAGDHLQVFKNQAGGHGFTQFDQTISGAFIATLPEDYSNDHPSIVKTTVPSTICELRQIGSYDETIFTFIFGFVNSRLVVTSAVSNSTHNPGVVGSSNRVFSSGEVGDIFTAGFTINGDTWQLYIDGVLDATGDFTEGTGPSRAVGDQTASLLIGASPTDAGDEKRFFNGKIGSGVLVNKVMSSDEMLDFHNYSRGGA